MQRSCHQCRTSAAAGVRRNVMNCTQNRPLSAAVSYSGANACSVISTSLPLASSSANSAEGVVKKNRSASRYVTRVAEASRAKTRSGVNGVSVQQYSPRVRVGLTARKASVSASASGISRTLGRLSAVKLRSTASSMHSIHSTNAPPWRCSEACRHSPSGRKLLSNSVT